MRRGFSLIEVTLALGIVSFGLLVMVGMLPIGLKSIGESMDDSVKTQIIQQITGKLLLTPYGEIDDFISDGPYYFTEEGILQSGNDAATFYQVNLQREAPNYPGVSGLSDPSKQRLEDESLSAVKIAISKIKGYGMVVPGVATDPFAASSLQATPGPSYQVVQVANSFGILP